MDTEKVFQTKMYLTFISNLMLIKKINSGWNIKCLPTVRLSSVLDSRPNAKVVKHFYGALPAEERQGKSVSVGGEWKKKTRKGRVKSKKEKALSSSDEMLFDPRMTMRETNSSPPPHVKQDSRGRVSKLDEEFSAAIKSEVTDSNGDLEESEGSSIAVSPK